MVRARSAEHEPNGDLRDIRLASDVARGERRVVEQEGQRGIGERAGVIDERE